MLFSWKSRNRILFTENSCYMALTMWMVLVMLSELSHLGRIILGLFCAVFRIHIFFCSYGVSWMGASRCKATAIPQHLSPSQSKRRGTHLSVMKAIWSLPARQMGKFPKGTNLEFLIHLWHKCGTGKKPVNGGFKVCVCVDLWWHLPIISKWLAKGD